jgi:glycosyltransferase involved in cell wall biosynthesis
MNVLVITGDARFIKGNPRFDIQASVVEKLTSIFWGKGSIFPKLPKEKIDVVTSQDPFLRGLFAWYVARHLRAKFNVQVHADLSAQSFFRNILAKMVLRHADSVRVVSEKIKKQVETIHIKAPISVLPVYVDLSEFRKIAHKENTQKIILWVGRFETEKDPFLAISVFEEVCKKGISAKLIMLGTGSLEKKLKAQSDPLSVEFPGWQDPKEYLAQADVVLCTSRYESWGASIVEALAAGVPVVAPHVGVAKEAGAIVVPREKIADAVIEVLQSGVRGELQLNLIENPTEWAEAWKKTL